MPFTVRKHLGLTKAGLNSGVVLDSNGRNSGIPGFRSILLCTSSAFKSFGFNVANEVEKPQNACQVYPTH